MTPNRIAEQAAEMLRRVRSMPFSDRKRDMAWLDSSHVSGFAPSCDPTPTLRVFVTDDRFTLDLPKTLDIPGFSGPVSLQIIADIRARPLANAASDVRAVDVGRGDQGWSGSLGCLVHSNDDDGLYILSNAHVLALTGTQAPRAGDAIISPSWENGGRAPGSTIAQLTRWTLFDSGTDYPNRADAAIAKIVGNPKLPDLQRQFVINESIVENMSVAVYGAASGRMRIGQVTDMNVSYELRYPQPNAPSATFGFRGLVRCSVGTEDGDSGSIVLDDGGRLVGLLFAGSPTTALFSPIKTVLSLLDIYIEQPSSGTNTTSLAPQPLLGFIPQVVNPYTAIDTLARTLWGEARNQGEVGMVAVAAVIANRANSGAKYGGPTVEGVCKAPAQFSCWNRPINDSDIQNRASMDNVGPENSVFLDCLDVARRTLRGDIADPTLGANHYVNLAAAQPSWATSNKRTVVIGAHSFYRL